MFSLDITSVVTVVVSVGSAIISALTYFQNGASSQLRHQQIERMRIVAVRAAILWDQVYTILAVEEIDNYLFPSIQNNASRLEQALDLAVSAGLMREVISDRPNALPLYTAFLQVICYVTTPLPPNELREACRNDHFSLGLIRLLHQCLSFGHNILPEHFADRDYIRKKVDMAWTYLDPRSSESEETDGN